MLGSGGVGKSLKIGFAQFSKAAYLKVKFKWECDRQAIHWAKQDICNHIFPTYSLISGYSNHSNACF